MAADGLGEEGGIQREAAEEVAPFGGDLVADLPCGLHHADTAETGPSGAVGEPGDVLALPIGAGLDAAVALLHGAVGGQSARLAEDGVVQEGADLAVGGAWVALEGQDVVGVGLDDLPGG